MGLFPSPFLNASTNIATFISGCAFLSLIISMPILFTIMNGIEEELIESREVYNEMAAVMWKDLRGEADALRRMPRQAYKEHKEVADGGGGGESNGRGGYVAEVPHGAGADVLVCPAGPKGVKGQNGLPGVDGLPGVAGRDGNTGLSDSASGGSSCPPCPAGAPGQPGYKGPRGPRGPKGEKGPAGKIGIDGGVGDGGVDGEPGHPGQMGAPGPRGAPGMDAPGNAKGAPGVQGEMGPSGPEGDEGLPGERGDDAAAGPQGAPGSVGVTGEAGADGIPGLPGQPGPNGVDAEYCHCPDRSKKGGAPRSRGSDVYGLPKEAAAVEGAGRYQLVGAVGSTAGATKTGAEAGPRYAAEAGAGVVAGPAPVAEVGAAATTGPAHAAESGAGVHTGPTHSAESGASAETGAGHIEEAEGAKYKENGAEAAAVVTPEVASAGPAAPEYTGVVSDGRRAGATEVVGGPPVSEAASSIGAPSPGLAAVESGNGGPAGGEYPAQKARAVDKRALARALRRKLVLKV